MQAFAVFGGGVLMSSSLRGLIVATIRSSRRMELFQFLAVLRHTEDSVLSGQPVLKCRVDLV